MKRRTRAPARDCAPDGAILPGVLAREHHAINTQVPQTGRRSSCTVIWVDPWISSAGKNLLNQPHGSDILHDRASMRGLCTAEMMQGVLQLEA